MKSWKYTSLALFLAGNLTIKAFPISRECSLLLELVNAAKLTDYGAGWGVFRSSPETNYLMVRHAVDAMGEEYPAAQPLRDVFGIPEGTTSVKATSPTKAAEDLNIWAKKNGTGFQFAWLTDKKAREKLEKKYFDEGGSSNTSLVAPVNGFVREDFFAWLLSKKIWPIADPHDLFTHAPNLLIPGFSEAMQRKGALHFKWVKESEGGRSRLRWETGNVTAHMQGPLRNCTWEGMSFLSHINGKPKLVIQGNAADAAMALLMKEDLLTNKDSAEEISDVLLGRGTSIDFIDTLEGFRRIEMYLERRPDAYAGVEKAVRKLGWDYKQGKELQKRLIQSIRTALKKVSGAGATIKRAERVLDLVAQTIAEDELLRPTFNAQSRILLLNKTLDFYEDYMKWSRRNN